MFENLTEKITNVFNTLKGKGIIDESSLNEALREIRIALLESDVSIKVAKDFIERIKERALGKEIIKSVSPTQMVVKIVNDELTNLLGSENYDLNLQSKPPPSFLLLVCKVLEKQQHVLNLQNGLKKIKKESSDGITRHIQACCSGTTDYSWH